MGDGPVEGEVRHLFPPVAGREEVGPGELLVFGDGGLGLAPRVIGLPISWKRRPSFELMVIS